MLKPKGSNLPSWVSSGLLRFIACSIFSVVITGVLCVPLLAGDPPHTESSGVVCADCHGGTLMANSPFWSIDRSVSAYNCVCERCHDEVPLPGIPSYGGEDGPYVITHAPGDPATPIKCTVCHHKHNQDQIFSGSRDENVDEFFLATGTAEQPNDVSYNAGSNTTVIFYDTLTARIGSEWADEPNLSVLADKTGEDRGAMLVPDTESERRWSVFMIDDLNIVDKKIIVKGEVAEASNLGIFYGQLINENITYNDIIHPVEFYDNTGAKSFTRENPPYGICQVCHTLTDYWTNFGTGKTHNPNTNCMDCHLHTGGFLHGDGGGSGVGCIECHGHSAGYEYASGQFSQGKGTAQSHSVHTEDNNNGPFIDCDGCHAINNFPYFKSDPDGNEDEKFSLAETKVCDPCHNDATGIATGTMDNIYLPQWNVISIDCLTCHAIGPDYQNGSPKANSHDEHSAIDCGKCHSATTLDGSSINEQAEHPNSFYTLQAGTGISFTYTFNANGGICSDISCHGGNSAPWGSTLSLACDSCHGYPPEPGDGKNINEQFDQGKGFHVTGWDEFDPYGMGGHIVNPANLDPTNDIYGDIFTGYNECFKCHELGIHGDGAVDVQISSGPWSTSSPKPSGLYERQNGFGFEGGQPLYNGVPGDMVTSKTCSNIVCHQGDTPEWSCTGGE